MITRYVLAAMLLLVSACQVHAQRGRSCIVAGVSDGDSIRCRDGSRVRLIGIDAPELDQEPYGRRSREALARRIPIGTDVRLELDVQPEDQYGRTLAYLWLGDRFINEEQAAEGFATTLTVPPNVRYAETFRKAVASARAQGAGLWAQDGFSCPPEDHRRKRC
jgi:micrococcal nuclease